MDTQFVIVIFIIIAAIAIAGIMFAKKTRSFSTKKKCGPDCSCGTK